jgi:hypothetical protein
MARRVTIDPTRVLITTYPDESWRARNKLCDETSGYYPRLVRAEWRWLSDTATALNAAVDAGPFTGITGIPERFIGHGYCTSTNSNWFRSLAQSLNSQGNRYGTFHATTPGHRQMALEVLETLCNQLYNGGNCSNNSMAREPGVCSASTHDRPNSGFVGG